MVAAYPRRRPDTRTVRAMGRRIVCFGATGFTGQLVVRALVRLQVRPVLAGRRVDRLAALAADCGGLEIAEADASDAHSVRRLVTRNDVLLTTVGPFLHVGWPAVTAACAAGAAYIDSTGEPPFVRRVMTELSALASSTEASLVPAFGHDYVPGNLAAALALREAPTATAVRIGYFVRGRGSGGISRGTAASAAGVLFKTGYAWRDGALRDERPGARMHTFLWAQRRWQGVSIAGSEHLFVPRLSPGVRAVDVYLGWAGKYSPAIPALSSLAAGLLRVPGASALARQLVHRVAAGSTGGPSQERRAAARTLVIAEALDCAGERLTEVVLDGPSPYDLTAELLAWAAIRASRQGMAGTGVLGPVDAFGLAALESAAAAIGLRRTGGASARPGTDALPET
jgi:short subunit dehydrogenase-like uncharacterized protein